MTVPQAIKELRRRLEYTQQRLALETRLSLRAIAGYELSLRNPEPAPLVRLATVAARAGHHDLAYVFLSELITQLRLRDLATGLLMPAQPAPSRPPVISGDPASGAPGLLLITFHDPALNGPFQAFFEAVSRALWGPESSRQEALEVLRQFETEALRRWGRYKIVYRETEDEIEYHASDGRIYRAKESQ